MSEKLSGRSGRWVSLAQAADLVGVTPRTIRRMVARGELTGYRLGDTRLLRLDREEVDRCLTAIPTAAPGWGVR